MAFLTVESVFLFNFKSLSSKKAIMKITEITMAKDNTDGIK
jgi:hypothetical protein